MSRPNVDPSKLEKLVAKERQVLSLLAAKGFVRAGEVSSAYGDRNPEKLQELLIKFVDLGVIESSDMFRQVSELPWSTVVVRPSALPVINEYLRKNA